MAPLGLRFGIPGVRRVHAFFSLRIGVLGEPRISLRTLAGGWHVRVRLAKLLSVNAS